MKRFWAVVLTALLCAPAWAQFSSFGRNKVQYTQFSWRVLRTEHFHIYYDEGMEDLARRGAAFAESAYHDLQQKFNHSITHPIPLIFYSSHLHFQQTNITPGFIPEGVGGFFEFLKGRVVIPSDGSTHQFAHVIRHELVHVFTVSKFNRVLLDHRKPADRAAPLWFTEGLAEFWSTEWDTQADMILRDAVVNNYVVGIQDMNRISGSFLMYKLGQNICQYIARRYGEEKLLLIFENAWVSSNFSEILATVLGVDIKSFDEEWLYSLRKRYYPLLAMQDLPSGAAKTIVSEGFNAKPVLSVSGGRRWLYFIGNHTGYTSIYRIDPDTKDAKPEVIVTGERSHEFEAFHPFQSKIAISQKGKLAFVTKSGETDVLHLYDLESASLDQTVRFRTLVVIGSPSWSPDGSRLVFSSIDKSGSNDLYVLDVATSLLTRLTNDAYDDRDPAWSPEGSLIAFCSDRLADGPGSKYTLFTIDTLGTTIRSVSSGKATYLAPAWSPDGRYLAYTVDRDGAQNVWVTDMSAPGGERIERQVTSFVTSASDPAWGDRDDLFMTVFENYSFQLRRVEDVRRTIDTSRSKIRVEVSERPAPAEPRRISGDVVDEPYRARHEYSLDLAQSQISTDPIFGTRGGAILAMSDLLGDDQYEFLIYNTAQAQSELLDNFNVAISKSSLGSRVNQAYGIFRLAGNRYDLTDPELFYYEKAFGGYYVLSYPLSRFQRVETGITISNSDKDNYFGFPRRALLLSNALSYVWDNSLWGPTGPVDGRRLRLTVAYTDDIKYSNVSYYTVLADLRQYFRLTTRSAWAVRGSLFYNEGTEARRFFMGGSWDLRGWPRWSIRGKKQWIGSQELRFPFIDALVIRFPFGPINFGSFRGALYSDFGGSWDEVYRDTKGSVGVGFRWSLGGALVLRYDVGKRIEDDLSKLQNGLFYQFFFGWDF